VIDSIKRFLWWTLVVVAAFAIAIVEGVLWLVKRR
jgi:hypothetical protein